jgi:hypothetical protein
MRADGSGTKTAIGSPEMTVIKRNYKLVLTGVRESVHGVGFNRT